MGLPGKGPGAYSVGAVPSLHLQNIRVTTETQLDHKEMQMNCKETHNNFKRGKTTTESNITPNRHKMITEGHKTTKKCIMATNAMQNKNKKSDKVSVSCSNVGEVVGPFVYLCPEAHLLIIGPWLSVHP